MYFISLITAPCTQLKSTNLLDKFLNRVPRCFNQQKRGNQSTIFSRWITSMFPRSRVIGSAHRVTDVLTVGKFMDLPILSPNTSFLTSLLLFCHRKKSSGRKNEINYIGLKVITGKFPTSQRNSVAINIMFALLGVSLFF